jgi:hypothetical protein
MAMKGAATTLELTCPTCHTKSQVTLTDFASGTVKCAGSTPHTLSIPNNARYRRLINEIDAAKLQAGEVRGLLAVRKEPYEVRYRPDDTHVGLFYVDSLETREIGVGHWRGRGHALSWQKLVSAELSVPVTWWLENAAAIKETN